MQETYLGMANKDKGGNNVFVQEDMHVLNSAAFASCDHLDGLVDGPIDNVCVIDWGLIECHNTRKIVNDTRIFH